jgi:putative addiction module component (TIGR02574 family)
MAATMKELGIDRMSADDRLNLVQEIWDSLAQEIEREPLTEAQRRELERRVAAHAANPNDVVPWGEVKERALASARK